MPQDARSRRDLTLVGATDRRRKGLSGPGNGILGNDSHFFLAAASKLICTYSRVRTLV
jgi:hypothetical protein